MRFINRLAFGLLLSCCGATALASNCPPPPDGLKPADGLCVQVFAHGVGAARHLAIAADGTVYVMTDGPARSGAAPFPALQGKGPIVALRDTDGDGRADAGFRFGKEGGTGLALAGTVLFAGEDRQVRRYLLDPASGRPLGEPLDLGLDRFEGESDRDRPPETRRPHAAAVSRPRRPARRCLPDEPF